MIRNTFKRHILQCGHFPNSTQITPDQSVHKKQEHLFLANLVIFCSARRGEHFSVTQEPLGPTQSTKCLYQPITPITNSINVKLIRGFTENQTSIKKIATMAIWFLRIPYSGSLQACENKFGQPTLELDLSRELYQKVCWLIDDSSDRLRKQLQCWQRKSVHSSKNFDPVSVQQIFSIFRFLLDKFEFSIT